MATGGGRGRCQGEMFGEEHQEQVCGSDNCLLGRVGCVGVVEDRRVCILRRRWASGERKRGLAYWFSWSDVVVC